VSVILTHVGLWTYLQSEVSVLHRFCLPRWDEESVCL